MDSIEAIILGIIQGLTEFLPVSSSGHLEIGKALMGDESLPQESLLFTVVLHFATALSTILIFRKEIAEIIRGLFKFNSSNKEFKFSFQILVSMIPAVIVGLFFEEFLETLFSGKLILVGIMLFITAILLFLADKSKRTVVDLSNQSAFIIGVSQAIAMLPGISRSGATIATSVLLGIDREKAARFSFLMVVPLIFGKILKDIMSGDLLLSGEHSISLLLGFLAAFLSGIIACKLMINIVKNSKLKYFSYYCVLAGVFSILLITL